MTQIDNIYQRMQDDIEKKDEAEGISEIAKRFEGLRVFLTGGTDMLGMCLLEKLLRSCPQLDKIYLLIRTKNGEDFQKKYNKLLENNIFDILKKNHPYFKDKIQPVKGDLTLNKLGLSSEDYETLTENTNVIFHNAAVTQLDKVMESLKTNILGTQRMLDLAHDCLHLKVFVFVSSCCSHNYNAVVEEKFYTAPADLNMINDMIEAEAQTGITEETLKMLMGKWSNIFSFTMATAEDIVLKYARKSTFACSVFRPSTVISTYKEPISSWCDNKNMPASFFVKIAMGAIHVLFIIEDICDFVPADLCANAIIVTTWDAVDRWQIEPTTCVYNYGSNVVNAIGLKDIKKKMMEDPNAFLSSKRTHQPTLILTTNFIIYWILRILFDYIPAIISDVAAIVFGNSPKCLSMVHEASRDMHYIYQVSKANRRIKMAEVEKACEKLDPYDRELFFCDLQSFDWDEYFLTFWRGIRLNFLKESPSEFDTKRCRCRCRCPCMCVGYGLIILFGLLVYYMMTSL